jgi:hypothetical protein
MGAVLGYDSPPILQWSGRKMREEVNESNNGGNVRMKNKEEDTNMRNSKENKEKGRRTPNLQETGRIN